MNEISELSAAQLERAIPASVRRRLIAGQLQAETDLPALRAFLGLRQEQLAGAVGVSVDTLQGWEQGLGQPDEAAMGLLAGAARRPRDMLERARAAG